MRRRLVKRTAALVLVLAAFLGARSVLRGWPTPASGDVPTAKVRRGTFVRKVRAEGTLKARTATPLAVPGEELSLKIAWLVEDGARVKAGDVVVRFDPEGAKSELDTGRAERRTADGKISKEKGESGAAVSNLGRDAEQAHRELETARTFQSKDPELFSRHEIIEADIDVGLAGRREEHAQGSRTVRESMSHDTVKILGADARKADLKIGYATKQLQAMEVRAPHDGIVVFKRNWRGEIAEVGQSLWSHYVLAELPDLATLEAEVWVLEADAGGLATGQRGTLVVEARPDEEIPATVRRVDAVAKPRQRGVPVQYFAADVELGKKNDAMKPGQRVVATLFLGEEKDALAIPRTAVFDRDGKKVVLRRNGRAWETVEVALGATGLGSVVVTKGVAEGDVVALADPARLEEPKGARPSTSAPAVPAAVRPP